MPKKIIQRVTDPTRAKAAFEFGVYSQFVCTPTLSEVLSCLRRDVPTVTLTLLLGLLRHIDHLCSEMENSRSASRKSDSSWFHEPSDSLRLFHEPYELRFRFAEVRELTDLAIPRFCELRPLFDLGRDIGALRQVVNDLDCKQTDGTITPKEIKVALAFEMPTKESCEALARFPEIKAVWDRVRKQLPRRNEIVKLAQDACTELEKLSVVTAREFLDALIEELRGSVCSMEFDAIAQDEARHLRNSWLYDQAKKCLNSVLLAQALDEKIASQPVGEKWDPCESDGIREALNSLALHEGVPPIEFPIGRPRGKTPKKGGGKAEILGKRT